MNKFLTCIIFVGMAFSGSAADYSAIKLVEADGTEHNLPSAGLEFTVNDGILTATTSEGTHSFPIIQLSKMFFSANSGTEAIASDCNCTVDIFNTDGTEAGSYPSLDAALNSLASGLYIVKTNGKSFKIAVK